ncbi:hypothetical protein DERF_000038, partial [Dermatophagoides farinae]
RWTSLKDLLYKYRDQINLLSIKYESESSIEHLAMIGHSIDIDCRFYFCSFTIYLSYGNS